MNSNKERKSMIKVRGGYSDRNGYNLVCNSIQVDEFDDRTRAILSNTMFNVCDNVFNMTNSSGYDAIYQNRQYFLKAILSEVFNETNFLKDYISWKEIFAKIDNVIKNAYANEVLDLIEFLSDYLYIYLKNDGRGNYIDQIYSLINNFFERECIGYRFVNGEIICNIDKTEITAIEEASSTQFDGCNAHIQKATHHLYDRDNPDYKNSVKESISAVESICKIIAGDGATLGDALKVLEKKHSLNKQLKAAFDKLYSYTNAEGGIRHAEGMFESNVTFEEAKFMLVSCCAFVNYLIAEQGKIEG